jgi:two-component system phosphate regulon response regulator PhoB
MAENENRLQIDALVLVPASGEAFLGGLPLSLTKTEFRLLLFLATSDGRAFSRKQIIEAVQGPDYPVTDRSIDDHVMNVRRKLGDYSRVIETVRGAGYRYRKQVQGRIDGGSNE